MGNIHSKRSIEAAKVQKQYTSYDSSLFLSVFHSIISEKVHGYSADFCIPVFISCSSSGAGHADNKRHSNHKKRRKITGSPSVSAAVVVNRCRIDCLWSGTCYGSSVFQS